MRHLKKGRRLGSDREHHWSIKNNLVKEIFEHERVKTTEAKAKEVCPLVEKIISLAKKGDLHSRRQIFAFLRDKELVHKAINEIGPRFAERNGGYTRIVKIGARKGDAAPMVLIELL